ncbi:MAG TPA: hypothetical protein VFF45_00325 [Bacilli bacterium]|nr:hypothetical protein [Bacilli bacterium]
MLGQSLRYTAAVLGASIAVALSLLLVHAFGLQGSELLLSLAAVTWVALHTGRAPALATALLGGLGTALLEPRGATRSAAVALVLYGTVALLHLYALDVDTGAQLAAVPIGA